MHATAAGIGDSVGVGVTGLRLSFAADLMLSVGWCEDSSLGSPLGMYLQVKSCDSDEEYPAPGSLISRRQVRIRLQYKFMKVSLNYKIM